MTRRQAGPAAVTTATVTAALSEFEKLRDEIDRRSQAQQSLLSFCLAAAGAIGGGVLAGRAAAELLLVLPLLSTALGMLFVDHAWAIQRLGTYLATTLRDVVVEATGETRLLGWELAARRVQWRIGRRMRWVGPIAMVFVGSGVAALLLSFRFVWLADTSIGLGAPFVSAWERRGLFLAGAAAVGYAGWSFARLAFHPHREI